MILVDKAKKLWITLAIILVILELASAVCLATINIQWALLGVITSVIIDAIIMGIYLISQRDGGETSTK
jgi:carbon starvation protein CstA